MICEGEKLTKWLCNREEEAFSHVSATSVLWLWEKKERQTEIERASRREKKLFPAFKTPQGRVCQSCGELFYKCEKKEEKKRRNIGICPARESCECVCMCVWTPPSTGRSFTMTGSTPADMVREMPVSSSAVLTFTPIHFLRLWTWKQTRLSVSCPRPLLLLLLIQLYVWPFMADQILVSRGSLEIKCGSLTFFFSSCWLFKGTCYKKF